MGENEKDPGKTNATRFELYCEKLGINPNLVMLKVTLFVMYGATASLLPFLTIHMQSIGLTVEEIAIVYLALPLTTFLSPPITGFLVDRFGHYKLVVVISLVLNGVFHQSLTLIPQMEIPGETPMAYVLRHPETGKVEVWWSPCPSRECPEDEGLSLVLDTCDDHCLLWNSSSKPPGFLKGIHQSIAVRPPTKIFNTGQDCRCGQSGSHGSPNVAASWGMLPEDLHFHLEKKKNMNNSSTSRTRKKSSSSKEKENSGNYSLFLVLDMHPDLMDPSEQFGIDIELDENDTVTDFRQHFSQELLEINGINYTALEEEDLRCGGFVVATNLTMKTLKELAADCMLQKCNFREGGPEVCPPNYKESDDHVFWTYFFLRFLGTTMLSASVTVMDPIALTMIQKYGGEFGRERLFSTLGMAIFSPLSGVLIDYQSRKLGYTDYSAAFHVYSVLLAVSCLTVLLMPIGAKMPADHLLRDMLKLIRMPHVMIFIFFLFALGNCWGFIESYLFLYLKELGAPNYLLGVTITVGTLSSVPFLYGAEKISRRIGHVNIIVIAFFSHAARLMGYSYIDNAWWCFPFEAMESLSVHLMWVAAATYCTVIAPKTLIATVIGVLGMAHFSLGRGSGSFAGGLLIGTVGIRQAFRIMGLMAIGSGIVYGIMHFFWLHKYSSNDDETDTGEVEKLNSEDPEKDEKEKLSESIERLSLMIRFNHRGSLASLTDHHRASSRRNSSNTSLLKSALETHHKFSNPQINLRTSAPQLAKSTFKISNGHMNNEPVMVGTPQQVRRNSKGIVATSTHIITSDEFRNRSDSIREEDENDGTQNEEQKEVNKTNTHDQETSK